MRIRDLFSLSLISIIFLASCGGGGGSDGGNNVGSGGSGGQVTANWSAKSLASPTVGSDGWGQGMQPTILMSDAGLATALWYRWDGTAVSLFASQNSNASQWSDPVTIESSSADAICKRAVNYCNQTVPAVIDGSGNITVAWPSWDGSAWRLAVNRFVAGQGWGTQTEFSSAGSMDHDSWPITTANLLVDDAGRVSVFWRADSGGSAPAQRTYWHAYFDGVSWSSAEISSPTLNNYANWAVDASSGEITFAWFDMTNGFTARIYTPGSGWGTASVLQAASSTGYRVSLGVNYDATGTATVVMIHAGSSFSSYAARHPAGSSWESSTTLATSSATTDIAPAIPQLIATSSGDLFALLKWRPYNANVVDYERPWRLMAFTYTTAAGWVSDGDFCCSNLRYGDTYVTGTDAGGVFFAHHQGGIGTIKAMYMSSLPDGSLPSNYEVFVNTSDAGFASTANGHAVVAYSQKEGVVRVRRYVPGDGWATEETVAALAPAESARPTIPVLSVNVSPSGHVFVLYYDVDYEAYAGVHYNPTSGWSAPGFFAGHSSRNVYTMDGVTSIIAADGHTYSAITSNTGGPGLQAFAGSGQVDVPFSTTITPRTAPATPSQLSGGTGSNSCSGTNNASPTRLNYTTQHFNYIRSCGAQDVQIGSLVDGADVYYDDYLNAINILHCTESEASATYAAHQETSLLAKRTADVFGCTP